MMLFKNILLFVFLLVVASINVSLSQNNTGKITIVVNGFKNNTGKARILIFSDKEKKYYPSEHKKAYGRYIVPIKNKKVTFTFENLPFEDYAISVHHDEDNNGKINTNWLGIPNEGLGASNDAKGNFGPPTFEQAKISLSKEELKLEINMMNDLF
ncbi:MAG: DUF2141 domain-containing protein [bacterium]